MTVMPHQQAIIDSKIASGVVFAPREGHASNPSTRT